MQNSKFSARLGGKEVSDKIPIMKRTAAVIAVLMLCGTLFAVAAKKPTEYAELQFAILNDENDRPIRNAAIVLHEVDEKGRQAPGGVELKTDGEGKASFAAAPYGKLRIQVIVRGFQTFGRDFVVDQPKHEYTIRIKRPVKQYSIYDK
jgi:hypothetical protein